MRSFDIQLHACSACQEHHRSTDSECPHCGHERQTSGSGRTAAAMLLGLAMAAPTSLVGCGDDTTGSGGEGGAGGASTTQTSSQNVSSAYGAGPTSATTTTDTSSVASAYGTGPTSSSTGGQ